ncbi:HTH-type transcriptional regulator/antitoxin HigA [Cricetibacter osteomyelitidis]|uniref:HTH-type transcriptional regulator/antitoxin HigA n=1 Tax=Cricetibacter osteomyelitidis TaxID=1521931 RepID=A0A4R2T660_9PAST|nr:transcriptional regulator [Cricetibacter osteomyelitidis]TCP96916.1 HTH-type transcriptional regulator/antitoxin HigA [Cricetibacter osteomyelitidis]
MLTIKPIKTEQDYKQALKEIEPLFDIEDELTAEQADFFEVMLALIENYESKHYPIDPPDPIEAIKFRMEQEGLQVKDMENIIGKPN